MPTIVGIFLFGLDGFKNAIYLLIFMMTCTHPKHIKILTTLKNY